MESRKPSHNEGGPWKEMLLSGEHEKKPLDMGERNTGGGI